MKATVTQADALTVATVAGDLDFESAGELLQTLRATVPNRALGLVLDLRQTTVLDSAGVALLFEMLRRLGRREQELHLVVTPGSLVADLLDDVRFAERARVHADLAEAIGELQALKHH